MFFFGGGFGEVFNYSHTILSLLLAVQSGITSDRLRGTICDVD